MMGHHHQEQDAIIIGLDHGHQHEHQDDPGDQHQRVQEVSHDAVTQRRHLVVHHHVLGGLDAHMLHAAAKYVRGGCVLSDATMREAAFIQRNKQRWHQLEQVVDGLERLSADAVSELYITADGRPQLRADLLSGQQRAALPERAGRAHHQYIHRNQRTPRGRFVRFWKEEVPLAMAATARPPALGGGSSWRRCWSGP